MEKMKERKVPVMGQAMNVYYTITASSEFREKERLRAKARHDKAQALYNVRKERDIDMSVTDQIEDVGQFITANKSEKY
ncbi:MAG: hypothetical protein HFH82_15635 [Lachnospiraceae bacterium]|nr:hypothetical protein [Lachnospiraceae bacterium]